MDHESIHDQILLDISDMLGDEWKKLAVLFRFNEAKIREIEINNQGNVHHQKFQMLNEWRQRQPYNQWSELCGALKQIKRNDIVLLLQAALWENPSRLQEDDAGWSPNHPVLTDGLRAIARCFLQQLDEDLDALECASKTFVKKRKAVIQHLNNLADELQKVHCRANKEKVAGAFTELVTTGLMFGGITAPPWTSFLLAIFGIGTSVCTSKAFLDLMTPHSTKVELVEILQEDKIAFSEFMTALKRVESIWKRLMREAWLETEEEEKQIFKVADSVYPTPLGRMGFDKGFDLMGFDKGTVIEVILRGSTIINGITNAVLLLPLDLYTVITSGKDIHKQTVPQLAQNIRKTAADLDCPSEQDMSEKNQRIRAMVCRPAYKLTGTRGRVICHSNGVNFPSSTSTLTRRGSRGGPRGHVPRRQMSPKKKKREWKGKTKRRGRVERRRAISLQKY